MFWINKLIDGKQSLNNYAEYIEEEYKRHYACQKKTENSRLRSQLNKINDRRTELKQKMVELEHRMTEIEEQIGTKEDETEDGLSVINNDNGILN